MIPLDRTLRSAKNTGCGRGADTVRASVGWRSQAIESLATLIDVTSCRLGVGMSGYRAWSQGIDRVT